MYVYEKLPNCFPKWWYHFGLPAKYEGVCIRMYEYVYVCVCVCVSIHTRMLRYIWHPFSPRYCKITGCKLLEGKDVANFVHCWNLVLGILYRSGRPAMNICWTNVKLVRNMKLQKSERYFFIMMCDFTFIKHGFCLLFIV